MRINCPYCGERDISEFSYLGDASVRRPAGMKAPEKAVHDYVYLRDNLPGLHREYWYHGSGCHACLIVTRNTVTHEIEAVEPARETMFREKQETMA